MTNILIYLGIALLAFAGGGWLCWQFCKKAVKTAQEYDEATAAANEQLKLENEQLNHMAEQVKAQIHSLELNEQQYIGKIKGLDASLKEAEESAKGAADRFYNQSMQSAQERLEHSLELEAQRYRQTVEDFQKEMDEIKEASAIALSENLLKKQEAIQQSELQLKEMQAKVSAAVEASKRAEEMVSQQNFYRIQLSNIDIDEIEKLRSVEPYLRDKEPLNKVIWKVYYEKPTNDLIGRVIGSGIHTGIYKITNIDNQKCYIGQAANLADRWKQHIKRGVGADAPTRNKLYPAMRELGPENFTFEVIEECDRSLLDNREDYWQDYFKAKEFGYSIK